MRAGAALLLLCAACATREPGSAGGARDLGPGGLPGAPGGLLSAGSYRALVLTPDDVALVIDAQATLFAVPIAGGAAQAVEANVSGAVRVNDAVFVWHDVDAQSAGQLAVFVGGQLRELSAASPADVAFSDSAASDGVHLAFLDNFSGGRADVIAEQRDGSGVQTLVARLAIDAACSPTLGFVAGKVVVSRCSAGAFSITAYDPDTGVAATLLAPASSGFVPVVPRAAVVALTPGGGSSLFPVDGSMATPLSAAVKRSLPLGDGSAVVQLTVGGGIVRARLPDGGLTSLVASGGDELEAVSADGAWVLYTGPPDGSSGDAALYLSSARQSGSPSAINTDKSTPPLVGGQFSDDAAWVVYTTDADPNGYGPLRARPLGGAGATIGASRTLSLGSTGFVTAGAGRIVYADGYRGADAGAPRIDVQLIDLAGPSTPTRLAHDAGLAWRLSDDARTLVFLVSDGKDAGLYATRLP